jgi:hypothetical protein
MLSIEEAIEFVKKFSIGHGGLRALGCEITVKKDPHYASGIRVSIYFDRVPDSQTGELGVRPYVFQHHFTVPFDLLTKDYLANHIRTGLKEAMAHEVDESLLFEGKRIFDPHK